MMNDNTLTTTLATLQQQMTTYLHNVTPDETKETLQTLVAAIRDQANALVAAHATLRQEHRDYQQLFDHAPDGYLITDMRGIIQRANRTAADLFRTSQSYLPGKPLRVYITEPDLRLFLNVLKQLQKGQSQRMESELYVQPPQGPPLRVAVRVSIVPHTSEPPTALHWLLHDTTNHAQIDLLRQSHDDLEYRVQERTDKLFQMNRTLQDEVAERRRIEAALRKAHQELENRVEGRTTELNTVVQALFNEVSEHQGTEAALRESQTLLQAILDNSPAAIFVRDLHGRFLLVNRHFATMHNYTSDEMVGLNLSDCFSSEEVRDWKEQDERVITTGKPLVYEQTNIVNGLSRTYLAVKFGIYDAQDTMRSLGVIAQDITDRKESEESMRQVNEQLRQANKQLQRNRDVLYTLIDGLKDGLLLLDSDGTILETNQALANLLGCDVQLLLNQRWDVLCRQQHPPFPGEESLLTLLDREPRAYRAFYTTPTGTEHILDIRSFPIAETQDTDTSDIPDLPLYSMIVHIADVTERFQLEAMMIQNERLASTGRLAAAIAHEINTPLQTIQTSLYMLDKGSEEERQQYLALSQEEMSRIKTTLGQFLEIHRSNDHAYAPVDFNALVRRMILLTSGTVARQNIQVDSTLEPDLPFIRGKANELNQVILNLMMNAIEAMPDGGYLTLKTFRTFDSPTTEDTSPPLAPPPYLVLEITDTGSGIEPRELKRIFDPFFTTKPRGTGLGLSISQRIIARHGGHITVRSTPGTGSSFTITIPLEGKYCQ